jgi:hypothetical protein
VGEFLSVFRVTRTTHVSDRLVVLLDERGVVEALAREGPPPAGEDPP